MAIFAPEESELVSRLRAGEETAFTSLIDLYAGMMLRVARRYVKDDASAEEIVQDTWLAVLQGIGAFRGHSTVKSWIFAILVKRAMTRGKRDARQIPFSSFVVQELGDTSPSVAPERFAGPESRWPRHWAQDVPEWSEQPEGAALNNETRAVINAAITALPPAQRAVVELRDISGQAAIEVAQALEISEVNVRVLLHRGRSKIRAVLEAYFAVAA